MSKKSKVLPVPVDGGGDAALKTPLRVITQHFSGLGDVGVGVLDVPGAVRSVDGLAVDVQRPAQTLIDVDQIFPATIGDVEGLTGYGAVCQTGAEIRLNDVVDIREVPRLPAVAVICLLQLYPSQEGIPPSVSSPCLRQVFAVCGEMDLRFHSPAY